MPTEALAIIELIGNRYTVETLKFMKDGTQLPVNYNSTVGPVLFSYYSSYDNILDLLKENGEKIC